ncbi:MAG: response regulator transcription factor [Bacteriovorax sp.]|nr:response regulator transcription factor [Bacteriovorax sp.]
MLNILIVEDEINLGSTLEEFLTGLGHQCVWAKNGVQANEYFLSRRPNLILMDIGLPDTNGIDLAKKFRALRKDFVLLFLSALNDPETKVEALEIGAEDYITKPFALKELILRLDRILKTQNNLETFPEEITHGPLKIWFRRYEVQDADQKIITLSQKECAILELLYKKQNSAVEREEIIEQVWGEDKFPSNRTVDNYIVKLRKWCESDSKKSIEIQSIRSIGYKLNINN